MTWYYPSSGTPYFLPWNITSKTGAGGTMVFSSRFITKIDRRITPPMIATQAIDKTVATTQNASFELIEPGFSYAWTFSVELTQWLPEAWCVQGTPFDVSATFRLRTDHSFPNGTSTPGHYTPSNDLKITFVGFDNTKHEVAFDPWALVDGVWCKDLVLAGRAMVTQQTPLAGWKIAFEVGVANGVVNLKIDWDCESVVVFSVLAATVAVLTVKDATLELSPRTRVFLDHSTSVPCRRGSV